MDMGQNRQDSKLSDWSQLFRGGANAWPIWNQLKNATQSHIVINIYAVILDEMEP